MLMLLQERDSRTLVCSSLTRTCTPDDLKRFFATSGKVRDVRMIEDRATRRFKGIAYVEFEDLDTCMRVCASGEFVLN